MKKSNHCPYAEGTDTLKFHYLVMSLSDAKKVDREIFKRRGPVCGKPIHPGSCMCKDHMRFSRGWNNKVQAYPIAKGNKKPFFTCQHSPIEYDSEERWIAHYRNGLAAGEWKTEKEAKTAIDAWNTKGGERVTVSWEAPADDADDYDRGTYIIGLSGTRLRITTGCQDRSCEIQQRLRTVLVKHGFEATSEILFSGQSQLTRFGWDGKTKATQEPA